jgi:hypothetical protein
VVFSWNIRSCQRANLAVYSIWGSDGRLPAQVKQRTICSPVVSAPEEPGKIAGWKAEAESGSGRNPPLLGVVSVSSVLPPRKFPEVSGVFRFLPPPNTTLQTCTKMGNRAPLDSELPVRALMISRELDR